MEKCHNKKRVKKVPYSGHTILPGKWGEAAGNEHINKKLSISYARIFRIQRTGIKDHKLQEVET